MYSVGDEVEVLVKPDEFGKDNWLPATVYKASDDGNRLEFIRRGNRLEKLGAINCGFIGNSYVLRSYHGTYPNVRPVNKSWGDCSTNKVTDAWIDEGIKELNRSLLQSEAEKRAMRSAVAWYVTFLERERDNRG